MKAPPVRAFTDAPVIWRRTVRFNEGHGAIRITGSPFKTFDEAEAACDAMLKHLTSD